MRGVLIGTAAQPLAAPADPVKGVAAGGGSGRTGHLGIMETSPPHDSPRSTRPSVLRIVVRTSSVASPLLISSISASQMRGAGDGGGLADAAQSDALIALAGGVEICCGVVDSRRARYQVSAPGSRDGGMHRSRTASAACPCVGGGCGCWCQSGAFRGCEYGNRGPAQQFVSAYSRLVRGGDESGDGESTGIDVAEVLQPRRPCRFTR